MAWRTLLMILVMGAALATEAADAPRLVLEESSHSLAPVYEGEPLEHAFEIQNRGGRPLHILDVAVS